MQDGNIIDGGCTLSKFPSYSPQTETMEDAPNRNASGLSCSQNIENPEDKIPPDGTMPNVQSSPANSNVAAASVRGLRQISVKICEMVQERRMTYNEVADELIHQTKEEQEEENINGKKFDEKNVRRRVYDALNVLVAVDVLARDEHKNISWRGIPDKNHEELRQLTTERHDRRENIKEKQEALKEQLRHHAAYRNLVFHNMRWETMLREDTNRIYLPFITLNAHPQAKVNCYSSRDKSRLMVDVTAPFAVNDDYSILRQMGFDRTTIPGLKELLPKDMLNYCHERDLLRSMVRGGNDDAFEPKTKRSKSCYSV